jgi:hypothetical protein
VATGHCIVDDSLTDDGILIYTPLNLALFVATTVGTPQANSIPILIDQGVLKVVPFSGAAVTMKLDLAGEGPIALATGLGTTGATRTCRYHLGMPYGDPATSSPNALGPAALSVDLGTGTSTGSTTSPCRSTTLPRATRPVRKLPRPSRSGRTSRRRSSTTSPSIASTSAARRGSTRRCSCRRTSPAPNPS